MGQHRDLKINYDSLKAIQAIVKKYKDALEDLQESTNTFADVIKAQEGDAFKELETEFEEDISVDYSSLISILGDVDTNIGNYMTDMTSYITPEDSSIICRVDRNDIWWNLQQIQGIPYGYLNSYPGVPSHWYMDEWVNPFADDADEVRARNAENQRKRERNYDKLNNFFNNSLKNTAQELWNETESIKSIYDNYVVSYENTDDTYSVKMNSIYYSIASLLDLLKDEVDTRIDFLRGFATGFVDLLKGLKAPLEIALAINPAIPLPPGVRAELLIDGTNEIYQGVKVFINDPENTIGAMFQGMFDTGDEEGTAFCVGYATEKVVEVIVAKKVADAMAGPKVTQSKRIPVPGDEDFVGPLADPEHHLIYGDGIGPKKRGVLGAHNQRYFYETLKNTGYSLDDLLVGEPIEHPTIKGIYSQEYRIPKYDAKGSFIGFKDIDYPKTIYDPNIISDSQMIQWGKEAIRNGVKSPSGNIVGRASNGLQFVCNPFGEFQIRYYPTIK